jgi:hypothetical protein
MYIFVENIIKSECSVKRRNGYSHPKSPPHEPLIEIDMKMSLKKNFNL